MLGIVLMTKQCQSLSSGTREHCIWPFKTYIHLLQEVFSDLSRKQCILFHACVITLIVEIAIISSLLCLPQEQGHFHFCITITKQNPWSIQVSISWSNKVMNKARGNEWWVCIRYASEIPPPLRNICTVDVLNLAMRNSLLWVKHSLQSAAVLKTNGPGEWEIWVNYPTRASSTGWRGQDFREHFIPK
jgi:hypothetical protein